MSISVIRPVPSPEETFARYVERVYPSKERLLEVLRGDKKLTIYHVVDPTAPHLHFGHATNYFLLRHLQDIGHQIILLIGDFTAQIGDPTGKSATRRPLTKKEVIENSKAYKEQAGKILDFTSTKNPATLRFNSEWSEKLCFPDLIHLASNFTVGQMIARDMFQERLKAKREVYLHEFLYPLVQGYDSVAMDVDGEVGGTDQTFNMLVGRDLMKILRKKEKFVITTPLLVNPKTGGKLMSKSEGGYIALNDPPQEMYGKVMALPDEVVIPCLRMCTAIPLEKIQRIREDLQQKKMSWRDAKSLFARESVRMYHGEGEANLAEKEFIKIFREKKMPSRLPAAFIKEKELSILDLLCKAKLAASKSEARRLVEQKGVKIDGRVSRDWKEVVPVVTGMTIQVGKRRFVKINAKNKST